MWNCFLLKKFAKIMLCFNQTYLLLWTWSFMTRASMTILEPLVDNLEALIHTTWSTRRRFTQIEMAEERPPLETYIQPQTILLCNAIRIPKGKRYDLKPSVLELITTRLKFWGISAVNPLQHLAEFTFLCEGLKGENSTEVTKMSLFLYTLRDRGKRWFL